MPFGRSRALDIHLTHRAFMYLSTVLVLALFTTVVRRRKDSDRKLVRAVTASACILVLQVLLGALNVWLGEHAWLVIVHLAVGTLLWASLVYVTMLALPARRPAAASVRAPEAEVAPA
jgi:heme A synthase